MPSTEPPPMAPEPDLPPLTETERLDSQTAKRSLRARLTGGPLLQAIGRVDTAGMRFIRGLARSRRATAAIRRYSHLGEHGGAWIAIGIAGIALDRRNRREWASGLAGVGAAYVMNTSLKQVARRPRPNFEDLPPLIPTPGPLSFPSSHSSSSAAAVIGYGGLLPRTPLTIAAATMAISRVHLGVHYPSDIAVGATLGTFVAKGVRRVLRPKPGR
ncbi:MAG: phosphatase PAP2 family protein [Solirubrobacteraceae bacterium]|nr:phosphatase PAP2 family protein [Solirubrobacteraceae bacterium]